MEALASDSSEPESPEPNIFTTQGAHRGEKGETVEASVTTEGKQVKKFIPALRSFTQFGSSAPVEKLWKSIVSFAQLMTSDYTLSPSHLECAMRLISDEGEVRVSAEILDAGDSLSVVSFKFLEGDRFSFNNQYMLAKDYFGGLVNAPIQ
jgi:hypothetical protein